MKRRTLMRNELPECSEIQVLETENANFAWEAFHCGPPIKWNIIFTNVAFFVSSYFGDKNHIVVCERVFF